MRRPAVDEPGTGLQVQFSSRDQIQFSARLHPPRHQQDQELWNNRRRSVSNRASSTTRCSLLAPIDGYPLHRKVTVDLGELDGEERMEPVNDSRIEIRNRSTAEPDCSVRKSSIIWRKPRSYRCHTGSAKEKFRIWYRVDTASPPMGFIFPTTKPGETRAFYTGDNTMGQLRCLRR